jgi:hypothetical protein
MKYTVTAMSFLLLAAACGGGGEEPTTAADLPTMPVDTLHVELEMGREMGDSTDTFSAIVAAAIDDEGRILVLDQVECALKMLDPAGEYIRHVARSGSGPGEFGFPWNMCVFPDGRLMVMDLMKQGFVVFDDSLEFVEELSLWSQNPPFKAAALTDSQYVAYKLDQDASDNRITMTRTVALYTYGEEEWDRVFWQDSIVANMSDIISDPSIFIIDTLDPLSICASGSYGVFFSLKDGEEYTVRRWDTAGEELQDITMELSPVEKTPEEIAAESTYVTNYVARMSGGGGFPFEFNPDPFKDMVIGLDIGPDGNLWVRRGTMDTPFFDIFDPATGELLRHVVFPAEGWSWMTAVSENGILAWEEDPELGYQKLYLLE